MSIPDPFLWDFAGFDGLALAREVFGSTVSELSAYQSLDTDWSETPCALLRLCENNFRVGFYEGISDDDKEGFEDTIRANPAGRRVWVKSAELGSIFLREGPEWHRLEQTATTKASHRLTGLPINRAVPVRIVSRAALVWRHRINCISTIEIQAVPGDLEEIRRLF